MSTWLFDSLVVTSLLMAIILIIRRPVAKLFGPGVAYALWLIPAFRLLMPRISDAAIAPASESSQAVRDAVRESIVAGVPLSQQAAQAAGETVATGSINYAALGLTLWIGGAALFFIVQMIRYASMRDDLLGGAQEIAVVDNVKVVMSDQVAGPLAFGLVKRYIAVPLDFAKTYSTAERELAIAHEIAHHKSGDLYANLVAFIVLCIQWFNPIAWMSWNAFRFDQEAACDARVMAGKDAQERAIYGQALARTAFDGVPTFATALNSPKTIIERLRRLTMKDASKTRRFVGKFGILVATAIILPLTATIVPAVTAHDEPTVDVPTPEIVKKHVKVIRINSDGKTIDVVGHEAEGGAVTKLERNGKTFIFRTEKELSESELAKMVAEAEASRLDADRVRDEAFDASAEAEGARASAEIARGHAEVARAHAMKMASSYIPEIDISEITRNCKNGEAVTTNVEGFDGKNNSHIRIVMCGKGQAKVARLAALDGLREARSDISGDKDIPEGVRKDVMKKLEHQIRRLESQADRN
ncbi:MAG: M56 family metallopeptidase [Sphingorhabdus sp.]